MDLPEEVKKNIENGDLFWKILDDSLSGNDLFCLSQIKALMKMGFSEEKSIEYIALHKSSAKYGYELDSSTIPHIQMLSQKEPVLKSLIRAPFILVKACWLYEHAPFFFYFQNEKDREQRDSLIVEFAQKCAPFYLGGKESVNERRQSRAWKRVPKKKKRRVKITTFWEREIVDPMGFVGKVINEAFDGFELCVDFHPFNYVKFLPEEFSFQKREEIRKTVQKYGVSIDIHSPIVGPYTPDPNPKKGTQRFFDPARCMALQLETVDLAKDIGASSVVFHLIDPNCPETHAALVERASGSAVRVTFENYCQIAKPQTSESFISNMDEILSHLPGKTAARNFGVTLDVGHLNIDGQDPLVGAERIGKWCRDKKVFIRVHATDNYGKLLFSPPAHSADVHSNVSGKGIDNALIIQMLRSKGLKFDVIAEQIKPLTPRDIATIHDSQTCTIKHSFFKYRKIGKERLDHIDFGAFINVGMIDEPAYQFLAGFLGENALREYLVYRQIQDKKHLTVDEAKKVSQDFRKVSRNHKIDLTSYIDDLLLPVQTESGALAKSEVDLIVQNISSVLYESIPRNSLNQIFSNVLTFKKGETVYEQQSEGREMYLVKSGGVEVLIDGTPSARLGAGKVFGEIGLFYNISRSATVKVTEDDTTLGLLDRKHLENLFISGHPVAYDLIYRLFNILPDRLRNLNAKYKTAISAFYLLIEGDLKNMPDLGHVQLENRIDRENLFSSWPDYETLSFERGELVFAEGDTADGAYYILEGKVKVVVSSESYREILLGKLDKGKIFGEMALIDDKPRSASIVTLTPCRMIFLDKNTFQEIIGKKTELAYRLMGFICLSLYRSILRLDKFYSDVKNRKRNQIKKGENYKKSRPGKIGHYLTLDPDTIIRGINLQQNYALKGIKKLLGQVLVEMQAISRDHLMEAIHLQRFERLKISPLFSNLTDVELKELSSLVYEKNVPPGKTFIHQDTIGESFFIIIEGEAKVYRSGNLDEEISLAVIGPGECVGEMGYFSDRVRSASVRALTDVKLIEIQYDGLSRAFIIAPKLAANFLDIVTKRLRRINLRLQDTFHRGKKAEHSLENLQNLLDFTDVIALRSGIEGLIHRVVTLAAKVMNADRASLFLIDATAGELWSKVAQGEEIGEIRIPIDRGIAGWVAQNNRLINIPDAYEDSRFDREVDLLSGYRTRSILCGPVNNLSGEIIGVIQVINKKDGIFGREDENLFIAFASQTAIAIENFNLYNQIIANHEKMTVFLDVATSLSQTLDLDILIGKIVTKVTEILDAERSSLFLLDKKNRELWSKVAQGSEKKEIRFPMDRGLAGAAVMSGEILNIPDAYKDKRFNPDHDRATGFRTKSVLCSPVINRSGETIGVTQTINKKSGYFTEEDQDILRALSSQIAVALENAQLYEQTLEMKNYLHNVYESISNGIITIDNDLRVVTINRRVRDFFETEDGIVGKDIRKCFESNNSYLEKRIEYAAEFGRPVSLDDLEVKFPTGKKHFLNINIRPLEDGKKKRVGMVLVFEDISREKRVKNTLSRYMSRDIAEKMLSDPEKQALGGVRNKATILFSDIRGFTGLAESLSAEKTVDFLNGYFRIMADIVIQHGGILDKYIGDAIMAVFGVPYPKANDSENAVATALSMRSALRGFNASMSALGFDPIEIGIGICTDEVISGNIGYEKRMDYTVIGDGVNVSARLESLNKQYGTKILISESTKSTIGNRFVTREIDLVVVKGKKKPIRIFEVLGDSGYEMAPAEKEFVAGLKLYRNKEFREAIRCFQKYSDSDPPSQVFLLRCKQLLENGIDDHFDGVFVPEYK